MKPDLLKRRSGTIKQLGYALYLDIYCWEPCDLLNFENFSSKVTGTCKSAKIVQTSNRVLSYKSKVTFFILAAQCLAHSFIKEHHLVPDQPEQYR